MRGIRLHPVNSVHFPRCFARLCALPSLCLGVVVVHPIFFSFSLSGFHPRYRGMGKISTANPKVYRLSSVCHPCFIRG
jgi:hypothetical protein